MIIAIDMDQTYTSNPDMWDKVLDVFKEHEATIYCVTCRPEYDTTGIDRIREKVDEVFFTDSEAKIPFMMEKGFHVDIWIDDTPATVTGGGSVMWRKNTNSIKE